MSVLQEIVNDAAGYIAKELPQIQQGVLVKKYTRVDLLCSEAELLRKKDIDKILHAAHFDRLVKELRESNANSTAELPIPIGAHCYIANVSGISVRGTLAYNIADNSRTFRLDVGYA